MIETMLNRCPDAPEERDAAHGNCGKPFVVSDTRHVCAARAGHQPSRVHVCLCGIRQIEESQLQPFVRMPLPRAVS